MWSIVIAGVEHGISNPVIEDQLEPYKIWCKFELPNTNEMRDLVAADVDVIVKISDKTVFEGVLTDPDYKDDKIIVDCADKVLNDMDDKLFIGDYTTTAANTILAAICAAAGVTAGVCPTTQVSVRFQNATCAHAAVTLSRMVNKDRWTTLGTTFNIGDRGSAKGAVNLALGHHKKSRSQKRDYIIYEGYDDNGVLIQGTAGSGSRKARFLSYAAKDVATLTLLAERKLAELNSETLSLPAAIDLTHYLEKDLSAGDTVTLSDDQKVATGSARIVKVKMKQDKVEVDLYRAEGDLRDQVAEERIFSEEAGVYPPDPNWDNPPGAPATPTGLGISSEISGIRIYWDENTEDDLDVYIIFRGIATDPTVEYARVRSTQFIDQDVDYGTTYYYRLKAVDRANNASDYSSEVSSVAVKVTGDDIASNTIVADALKKGIQPFTTNVVISPGTASPEDSIEWTAGSINFADGTTYTIDITASPITGLTPGTFYYVYFDVDDVGNDLHITSTYTDAVSDTRGLLAIVGCSSETGDATQDVFIQSFAGKGQNYQADVIAANAIFSKHITTMQIIGKDFRTSLNVGEGGGPVGIRITPNEIAGYSGGTTKQFYLSAADGKAYAAAGAVILDSTGLSIKGEKVWLKDAAGNTRGVIYGTADSLTIKSVTDDIIISQLGSGKKIYFDGADVLPTLNEALNIGSATKRILTVFCKTLDVTDAVPPGAHETTHRDGGSDPISGALKLDAIPILPHTKVDFADQNLLQASDAIFNSVKGTSSTGAIKAGNEITLAWDGTYSYLASHNKDLMLSTVVGKKVIVERDLQLNNILKFKEPGGNWIDLWLQLVEDMAFPDEYNPFIRTDQGFWCNKDIMCQGFVGSASRIFVTFGATYTPCVPSDIGKQVKDDGAFCGALSGYDNSLKKWWIVGFAPILSGSSMTIPSGTGAGITNADWATQPGGGAFMCGHGLTAVDDPPHMTLSSSELGFDRFHFFKLDGETLADIAVDDIELTTINSLTPLTGVQVGSDVTNGSGDKTVTFGTAFAATPKIQVTIVDASGRMITIVIVSKSTTQFVVKAKLLETHKHKIGQAAATAAWTMGIANDGEHYHGFGMEHGGAAVDIAHDHGTHRHGFPAGQAAVDIAHDHGTHRHGFPAEQAAVDIAHVHTLGETLKDVGGTTGSESSHTHVWSDSFTTGGPSATVSASQVTIGVCPLGHTACEITNLGTVNPASSAHTHSGSVGGTSYSGTAHSHGFPGTAAVDIAHVHTLGETLKEVGGYTGYTGVSIGETLKEVGGVTGYEGVSLSETLKNVGGYTGDAVPTEHNHEFTNKAPYARGINLRDSAGDPVEVGATMMTITDTAVDLFTEAPVLAGVVVNFDWMAMPA